MLDFVKTLPSLRHSIDPTVLGEFNHGNCGKGGKNWKGDVFDNGVFADYYLV